jgi:hypothetical protein
MRTGRIEINRVLSIYCEIYLLWQKNDNSQATF